MSGRSRASRKGPAPPPAGARQIAAQVLARVWQDGAYAALALDAELRRATGLDEREARLATELVYGVLRTAVVLERRLEPLAKRTTWKRQPLVRAHLLIAAYTMAFLDRIPPYAAVDEAVTAIGRASDKRVAGFANAVLRKLARGSAEQRELSLEQAALAAVPGWLRAALDETLGADEAERFLTTGPVPPALGLCLRARQDRDEWMARLRAAAPQAELEVGAVSPRCVRLRGGGDPRRLPGADADWIVQEEGAQLVALALGAEPAERVLDACAGRGGKAWLLAEQVGPSGAVHAADRAPAKLDRLRGHPSWGRSVAATFAVDWTRGSGDVPEGYDRALVDAPCSGVGTLRRRPELAGRLAASDVVRLAAIQVEITRQVATRVRDGGRMVYAVCSVLRQETDEVVRALCEPAADDAVRLEPSAFEAAELQALAGDASSLRLLPQLHGTDGYFMASFVVRR